MPIAEWACYVTALPRLDAEQTLRDAEAAALPWMTPRDRRRTAARLRALAAIDHQPVPGPLQGMAVRHVPSDRSPRSPA